MALQLLILALLLLAAPVLAGGMFVNVDRGVRQLPYRWICGQICLWAGFQLICVPFVLAGGSFRWVTVLYSVYSGAAVCLGAAAPYVRWKKKSAVHIAVIRGGKKSADRSAVFLWTVFAAVLLFQLIQAVRLAYADGDDAFYVAISTIVQDGDEMYRKLPYTGGATGLDARHGLAPFSVWTAYLARLSGMEAVSVSHVVLPVVLISMSYGVLYLTGRHLFPKRDGKLPLFLCFAELLVLFGNYSLYTVESFMLARSRQGKAALGSIVIPFLFYLLFLWLKRLEKQEKVPAGFYVLLLLTILTGCLCSTLGALLTCMLVGIVAFLGAAVYKRWRQLFPMAVCCIPCVCYAVLYLLQD